MHKSRLASIIIDCCSEDTDSIDSASRFWSEALGLSAEQPDDPKNDKYRRLFGPADQPAVLVQQVNHESRIHLDIEADDIEAEVTRLEGLGAVKETFTNGWWVMRAPTGQRFCVVKPQREDFSQNSNEWGDSDEA